MQSGRRRLREWIERSKVNQREAAEIMGVHPVLLNEWLGGSKKPGLASALAIEQTTGISAESWLLTDVSDDEKADARDTGKRKLAKG